MTDEQVKILHDAVVTYGKTAQVDKAIEEMSELTKALLKERHNAGSVEHIAEEMADVFIMIAQLILVYNNDEAFDEQVDHKIKRLQRRLKQKEELK